MKKYFNDKQIMIIVPHEDDELNIVGGLLASNYFNHDKVKIVFVTNGDYLCNGNARISEAMKVAKKLKIPNSNIIFLGYSDQNFNESSHIYMTKEPDILISKKGNFETFCFGQKKDFSFDVYGEHSRFNCDSLLKDFINIISLYKPDLLFTIDFDSHPDHRATTLIFDKAMGTILKKYETYKPLIYKGFAYPTAYKGIKDFNELNFNSTKFLTEDYSKYVYQNPYYEWDERVRFPVFNSKLLIFNKFYKLLKCHRSQLIIKRTYSIVNSDHVFFQRSSNNLCLDAKIEVTSGNGSFLNDFVTFDLDDIMNGNKKNPVFKNVSWIPDKDDLKKEIKITFSSKQKIEKINFYQNLVDNSFISKLCIEFSNGKKQKLNLEKLKESCKIYCNDEVEWLKINIIEFVGELAGFSEIEILSVESNLFDFFNVEINDSFVHDKLIVDLKQEIVPRFYYYNGVESRYLDYDCILNNGESLDINNITYGSNIFQSKDNSDITKKVFIRRKSICKVCMNKLISKINNLTLNVDIFIGRFFNKINRLLKKL